MSERQEKAPLTQRDKTVRTVLLGVGVAAGVALLAAVKGLAFAGPRSAKKARA